MADEIRLLTKEDLRKLPRWARVAFAARCGRRAQRLISLYCPNASAEHLDAIEQALAIATRCALRAAQPGKDVAIVGVMLAQLVASLIGKVAATTLGNIGQKTALKPDIAELSGVMTS